MNRRRFLKMLPVVPVAFLEQAKLQEQIDKMSNNPFLTPEDVDQMTYREAFMIMAAKITRLEKRR